jgi:hypothetical protein
MCIDSSCQGVSSRSSCRRPVSYEHFHLISFHHFICSSSVQLRPTVRPMAKALEYDVSLLERLYVGQGRPYMRRTMLNVRTIRSRNVLGVFIIDFWDRFNIDSQRNLRNFHQESSIKTNYRRVPHTMQRCLIFSPRRHSRGPELLEPSVRLYSSNAVQRKI